jgi:hypothetical protein
LCMTGFGDSKQQKLVTFLTQLFPGFSKQMANSEHI